MSRSDRNQEHGRIDARSSIDPRLPPGGEMTHCQVTGSAIDRHPTRTNAQVQREEAQMKLHEFPRYPLTFGPSPVHRLARLTAHLGGAQVWAKREDVSSGLAFGGNKVRKLEYIVPDVLASGADTLVSIGGVQSNHTRQVAAVAAHLGLKARLVQERWVPWDDPVNDKVGNILLSRMMGADIGLDPAGFDIGIRKSWERALREVEESGGKPYAIPAGASEHRLGGLGFANWAFEVAEQEKSLGVHFDTIIVCTVTGSTHAGMIAGFAALEKVTGVRRRVLGIDASATLARTTDQVARIARHTAELIELGRDLADDEVQVLEGWAGDLYGIPVESTMEAMRLGAELEAMITDPVYEGKSLAGLIDLVRSGEIPRDSTVLYAHLGGQPALNAYHSLWA
jgi:1-aminocyclopropane-1-carboxylate deaminase